jgi:hypothetical protein
MYSIARTLLLSVAGATAWCVACAAPTSDGQQADAHDDNFRLLTETYTIGRRYLASEDRYGSAPPVDAWGNPMVAESASDGASVLRSAGRDRASGTRDDILIRAGAKFRPAGPSGYKRPVRPAARDARNVL